MECHTFQGRLAKVHVVLAILRLFSVFGSSSQAGNESQHRTESSDFNICGPLFAWVHAQCCDLPQLMRRKPHGFRVSRVTCGKYLKRGTETIFLRGLGSRVSGFIDITSAKVEKGKRNLNHKMVF